ncbi:unnamed protein product [Cyclocybe aegerita]|uniref:Uncharacterized protein n=1 Tax=Cyclocybe aegerita TaxID=1973307 RepID=A0A8S0WLM7_CYCAE|nr:unnamed protein product [Cyclocybe aegerita]
MEGTAVEGTASTPSQHPAAGPSAVPKKKRNQLTPGGNAVLEDYWRQHASLDMPDISARRALLGQIQKHPGCEFYAMANVNQYFRRQIQKLKPPAPQPEDFRFPSLTPDALKHLSVLVKEQPNPSETVLKTWATLLAPMGATERDILAWSTYSKELLEIQAQSLSKSEPISASMRLPTPSDTVTPEPLTAASSMSPQTPIHELVPILVTGPSNQAFKHYKIEAQSPVIPAQQPFNPTAPTASYYRPRPALQVATMAPPAPSGPTSTPQSMVMSPIVAAAYTPISYTPISPAGGDPPRGEIEPPQLPPKPALRAIIEGVTDALADPRTPQDEVMLSPTSATEFEAVFATYRQRLAPLIHELDS